MSGVFLMSCQDLIKAHKLKLTEYSSWTEPMPVVRHEDWWFILDDTDEIYIESLWPSCSKCRNIVSMTGPRDEMERVVEVLNNGGFDKIASNPSFALNFLPKSCDPGVMEEMKSWGNNPEVQRVAEQFSKKRCEKCGGTGKVVLFRFPVDCECVK